jgi:hypothetical protein
MSRSAPPGFSLILKRREPGSIHMCLLIHQPSSTVFSDDFLVDVYSHNQDGLGLMYATGGKLVVVKSLPETAEAFVAFYRAHAEGRECVIHARMRTHGDVDLENCHPYAVTDRVALCHNGILSTGNSWDRSRSDTWHFVRNVVAPALEGREALLADPDWQAFMGSLIGSSNKLGLMSADGTVAIINRASGVEFEGAWLSNTYAWTPARHGVGSPPRHYTYGSTRVWDWEADELLEDYRASRTPAAPPRPVLASTSQPSRRGSDDSLHRITRAARNSYWRGQLDQWVLDAPHKAARLVDAIDDDPTGASGERAFKNPKWVADRISDYFEAEAGTARY